MAGRGRWFHSPPAFVDGEKEALSSAKFGTNRVSISHIACRYKFGLRVVSDQVSRLGHVITSKINKKRFRWYYSDCCWLIIFELSELHEYLMTKMINEDIIENLCIWYMYNLPPDLRYIYRDRDWDKICHLTVSDISTFEQCWYIQTPLIPKKCIRSVKSERTHSIKGGEPSIKAKAVGVMVFNRTC